MAIAPPGSNYKREVAAIIVTSMAASANPIAGFCLEMLKLCWPPNSAIDEARWPAEITDTVNCIEERIDAIAPRLVPSEDALCLGRWMSRNAECGFADIFDDNAFLTAFPANSPREILDALGELSAFGLLNISLVIGRPFGHVQLSSEFYAVFDPIAFPGINPRVDAIDVAIALLQSIQSSISAETCCPAALRACIVWLSPATMLSKAGASPAVYPYKTTGQMR